MRHHLWADHAVEVEAREEVLSEGVLAMVLVVKAVVAEAGQNDYSGVTGSSTQRRCC